MVLLFLWDLTPNGPVRRHNTLKWSHLSFRKIMNDNRYFKDTEIITFSHDGKIFVFFISDPPVLNHCFNCSVLWSHVNRNIWALRTSWFVKHRYTKSGNRAIYNHIHHSGASDLNGGLPEIINCVLLDNTWARSSYNVPYTVWPYSYKGKDSYPLCERPLRN